MSFLSTLLAAILPATAPVANYTDMVLVNDPVNPFYIDIFETTAADANNLANGASSFSSRRKPARIDDFSKAVAVCAATGKRLPTQQEWLAAASNLGNNQRYTLVGDNLMQGQKIGANVLGAYAESLEVTDFLSLGIDAVGTVGMTGNRAEWVSNNGAPAQCGGDYDSAAITSANNLLLSNICSLPFGTSGATVRCVADKNPQDTVTLSAKVTGGLLTHVQTVMNNPVIRGNIPVAVPNPGVNQKTPAAPNAPAGAPPIEPIYDKEFRINKDQPLNESDLRILPITDYLVIYHETAKFFTEQGSLTLEPGVYVASRGILNLRSDLQNLIDGAVWENPFGDRASITAGYAPGTVAGTRNEIWAIQNNQYFKLTDNDGKLQALIKGVPYKIFSTSTGAFFLTKDKNLTFIPRKTPNVSTLKPFQGLTVLNENYVILTRDSKGLIFLGESQMKGEASISVLRSDGTVTPIVGVPIENGAVRASISAEGIFIPTKTMDPNVQASYDVVGFIRLADNGNPIERKESIFQTRPGQSVIYEVEWPEIRTTRAAGGRVSFRLSPDGSLSDKATGGVTAARLSAEDIAVLKAFAQPWSEMAANGQFDDLIDRSAYVDEALNTLRSNKNTWVNINGPFGVGKTELLRLIARTVQAKSAAKKDWIGYSVYHLPLSKLAGSQAADEGQTAAAQGNKNGNVKVSGPQGPNGELTIEHLMQAISGKQVIIVMDDFLDDPALGPTNPFKSMDIFMSTFREKITSGQVKIVTSSDSRLWSQAQESNPALNNMVNTITVQSAGLNELTMVLGAQIRALEKYWRLKFDPAVASIIMATSAETDPTTQEPHRSIKAAQQIASTLGNPSPNAPLVHVSEQKARSILLTNGFIEEEMDIENLGQFLASQILGQKDALERITNSMQSLSLGVTSRRGPRAVLFLIGPTGTGKTYTAELLAQYLKKEIVKVDMTKFSGFNDHNTYTQKIKSLSDKDYVLILDDIDKSPNASKILQDLRPIFDDGVYGAGTKDTLSFRNAIIFITGNYAAQVILDAKTDGHEIMKNKVRDHVFSDKTPESEKIPKHVWSRIESSIVIFRGLDIDTMTEIAKRSGVQLSNDMRHRFGIEVILSNKLISNLVHKSAEAELGAVPVQRKIEIEVKQKIALHMSQQSSRGNASGIKKIVVTINDAEEIILVNDLQKSFASALKQASEPTNLGDQK